MPRGSRQAEINKAFDYERLGVKVTHLPRSEGGRLGNISLAHHSGCTMMSL